MDRLRSERCLPPIKIQYSRRLFDCLKKSAFGENDLVVTLPLVNDQQYQGFVAKSSIGFPLCDAHSAHAVGAGARGAPEDEQLRNDTVAAGPPAEHNRAVFMT
jgi:hypothetical protein